MAAAGGAGKLPGEGGGVRSRSPAPSGRPPGRRRPSSLPLPCEPDPWRPSRRPQGPGSGLPPRASARPSPEVVSSDRLGPPSRGHSHEWAAGMVLFGWPTDGRVHGMMTRLRSWAGGVLAHGPVRRRSRSAAGALGGLAQPERSREETENLESQVEILALIMLTDLRKESAQLEFDAHRRRSADCNQRAKIEPLRVAFALDCFADFKQYNFS